MTKTASKSSLQKISSLQAAIFAVLMYSLYDYPRNLKFKQEYQQDCLCFEIIFPFVMTMYQHSMLVLILPNHVVTIIIIYFLSDANERER